MRKPKARTFRFTDASGRVSYGVCIGDGIIGYVHKMGDKRWTAEDVNGDRSRVRDSRAKCVELLQFWHSSQPTK